MDFKTPLDRVDDPGVEKPMHAPFEPVVPCSVMETRPCVARWDGPSAVYAATVCPEICWRFRRPVEGVEEVAP